MSAEIQNTAVARVLETRSDQVSLKRAAWAFGCAKKGSEEEMMLRVLLLRKVRDELLAAGGCP